MAQPWPSLAGCNAAPAAAPRCPGDGLAGHAAAGGPGGPVAVPVGGQTLSQALPCLTPAARGSAQPRVSTRPMRLGRPAPNWYSADHCNVRQGPRWRPTPRCK